MKYSLELIILLESCLNFSNELNGEFDLNSDSVSLRGLNFVEVFVNMMEIFLSEIWL